MDSNMAVPPSAEVESSSSWVVNAVMGTTSRCRSCRHRRHSQPCFVSSAERARRYVSMCCSALLLPKVEHTVTEICLPTARSYRQGWEAPSPFKWVDGWSRAMHASCVIKIGFLYRHCTIITNGAPANTRTTCSTGTRRPTGRSTRSRLYVVDPHVFDDRSFLFGNPRSSGTSLILLFRLRCLC